MPRLFKELSLHIEQHVVQAPSVCANGDGFVSKPIPGNRKPSLDFPPESGHIPAQGVAGGRAPGWKPVELLELEASPAPKACDEPAAFSSEIEG